VVWQILIFIKKCRLNKRVKINTYINGYRISILNMMDIKKIIKGNSSRRVLERCLSKNDKQELGKAYCLMCGKKEELCSCTEKEKDAYIKRNF